MAALTVRPYRLIGLCHCAVENRPGCAAGLARVRTTTGKLPDEVEIGAYTYRRSRAWTRGGAVIFEAVAA